MRGRNRNNSGGGGGNKGPNPLTRSYESNGPDVKVRGNAQTIAEKYMQLARDAASGGDPVAAESYYQHAEHYVRIVLAAHEQLRQQFGENYRPQRPFGQQDQDEDGDEDGDDTIVDPASAPQPGVAVEGEGGESGGTDDDARRDDRSRHQAPRQERGDRFERPRHEGQRFDRSGQERSQERGQERGYDRGERFDRGPRRDDRGERRFDRGQERVAEGAEAQERGQERGAERSERFDERGERRFDRDRFDRGPRRDRDDRGDRRFDRPRDDRRPAEDDAGAVLPAFLTAPVPPRAAVTADVAPEPMAAETADAPAPKRRGRPPKAKAAEPAAE